MKDGHRYIPGHLLEPSLTTDVTHSDAGNWPPLCRRQLISLMKLLYFDSNFIAFVALMAWRETSDKTLLEPIMTQCADAYKRHPLSMGANTTTRFSWPRILIFKTSSDNTKARDEYCTRFIIWTVANSTAMYCSNQRERFIAKIRMNNVSVTDDW